MDIGRESDSETNSHTMKQISPLQAAADAENQAIFDLLVEHLHTTGSKFGDSAFNEIWSKEQFDTPVSNPWRTLTKVEAFCGPEVIVPTLSEYYGHFAKEQQSNSVRWKSVLLLSAIRDSQFTAVQLLIRIGANVNYQDGLTTPLHVAAFKKTPVMHVSCSKAEQIRTRLMKEAGLHCISP